MYYTMCYIQYQMIVSCGMWSGVGLLSKYPLASPGSLSSGHLFWGISGAGGITLDLGLHPYTRDILVKITHFKYK